jgi:lambda repressor-like predicted transcriptional regulator
LAEHHHEAKLAYYYARDVLNGRFPAGEAVIAKDAGLSYCYAKDVVKGRFPEGEAAIAKEAGWACWYAYDVLKGRFPKGEPVIAKDACWSHCYARDILRGRFPAGEAAIANSVFSLAYSAFLDSMILLKKYLNEMENAELEDTGAITVETANGAFLVSSCCLIKSNGKEFCVAFEDESLPAGDLMLAKVLLLKADPKILLSLA